MATTLARFAVRPTALSPASTALTSSLDEAKKATWSGRDMGTSLQGHGSGGLLRPLLRLLRLLLLRRGPGLQRCTPPTLPWSVRRLQAFASPVIANDGREHDVRARAGAAQGARVATAQSRTRARATPTARRGRRRRSTRTSRVSHHRSRDRDVAARAEAGIACRLFRHRRRRQLCRERPRTSLLHAPRAFPQTYKGAQLVWVGSVAWRGCKRVKHSRCCAARG